LRRTGGELLGDFQGAGERIVGHLVHQADLERRRTCHHPAAQDHFQRFGLADDARQALGPAAAWKDADAGLRKADGGHVSPRDADVAGQAELEAAAHAKAVDGRNHRLFGCGDQVGQA